MLFSPFSALYQKISAQLTQYGVMPTGADEVAFKTWLLAAWADSGFTQDFAALYQDASSTTFSVGVRVGSSGHKVNVWWGDGTSNGYSPSTGSNTTVSKTWGSGAKRAIVLIGRITRWEGTSQKYGGRLWENLRSLTVLSCWGCTLLTGSINSLPSGMTVLYCGGCSLLTGSINSLPSGLTYLDCGGCTLLTGSINSLPSGLTVLSCWDCTLLTGSINSLPSGLTYLYCGGCSLLTGSINSLPSGMTVLYCGGCSLLTGSINNLPSGMTYLSSGGCSLLTGSINSLPSGLTYLDCWGCQYTYATSSGSRVWANAMRRIYIAPPSVGVFTGAMVDAILIDLASVAAWTNEKFVYIAGNCGAHTAASNAAIATIQGKGVTVTVN